jgi:hypothetical protein
VIVSPVSGCHSQGIGDLSEAEDEQSLSCPKARVVFRASSDDAPLGQAAYDHLCGCGTEVEPGGQTQ